MIASGNIEYFFSFFSEKVLCQQFSLLDVFSFANLQIISDMESKGVPEYIF